MSFKLVLMATLTYIEKQRLEKLLGMGSGYVWKFSDKTFREFVQESTDRNIDNQKYMDAGTSKANRLRTFWLMEPDQIVGKLLDEMLQLVGDDNPGLRESDAYKQSVTVAQRLLGRTSLESDRPKIESGKSKSAVARHVFVVYGRDAKAKREMFRFLRGIGLKPIDFIEAIGATGKATPYIGEA